MAQGKDKLAPESPPVVCPLLTNRTVATPCFFFLVLFSCSCVDAPPLVAAFLPTLQVCYYVFLPACLCKQAVNVAQLCAASMSLASAELDTAGDGSASKEK